MNRRNLSLDILKVAMAFMVVGLHGDFLSDVSPLGSYLTVNGIFRIAVPVFFLVNGYYFISVTDLIRLKRWAKRVIYLYVFWMLFYVYFWFRPESVSMIEMLKLAKTAIVGYHHLWYLSGMLGAGILTFLVGQRLKLGTAIATVGFVIGTSIQYAGNYHAFSLPIADKIANMYWAHRNFLFFGFPFFYLGYLINKKELFKEVSIYNLAACLVLSIGLLELESWYNFNNPNNDGGFDNYASLILVSPILFLMTIRSSLETESKGLAFFSTAIYLIHPFWLSILRKFTELESTQLILFCIVISILSSVFIVQVRKKWNFIL